MGYMDRLDAIDAKLGELVRLLETLEHRLPGLAATWTPEPDWAAMEVEGAQNRTNIRNRLQGKTLVEIFEEEDADEDFKAWLISNAGDFSPDGL